MNIIDFKKRSAEKEGSRLKPREIWSHTNKNGAAIVSYECLFDGDVRFRLRRAKDHAVVCEYDKSFNMIGDIKIPVDLKSLNDGIEAARSHWECWVRAGETLKKGKELLAKHKDKLLEANPNVTFVGDGDNFMIKVNTIQDLFDMMKSDIIQSEWTN